MAHSLASRSAAGKGGCRNWRAAPVCHRIADRQLNGWSALPPTGSLALSLEVCVAPQIEKSLASAGRPRSLQTGF